MLNWDDYRIFLDVARSGSLSAASIILKIDVATVGRRITRLETALNSRLFNNFFSFDVNSLLNLISLKLFLLLSRLKYSSSLEKFTTIIVVVESSLINKFLYSGLVRNSFSTKLKSISLDLSVLCSLERSENPTFGLSKSGTSKIVKTLLTSGIFDFISFDILSSKRSDSLLYIPLLGLKVITTKSSVEYLAPVSYTHLRAHET